MLLLLIVYRLDLLVDVYLVFLSVYDRGDFMVGMLANVLMCHSFFHISGVGTRVCISISAAELIDESGSPANSIINCDRGWLTISKSLRSRCRADVVSLVVLLSVLGAAKTAHDFCKSAETGVSWKAGSSNAIEAYYLRCPCCIKV